MKYYENNGSLYTSNVPIEHEDFVEITKEEYELRLSEVKIEYTPPSIEDEWGSVDIAEEATEEDYKNALEEMGVVCND